MSSKTTTLDYIIHCQRKMSTANTYSSSNFYKAQLFRKLLPNEDTPADEKFSLDDIKAIVYSIKVRDHSSANWKDLNSPQYVTEMRVKLGQMVSDATDNFDHHSIIYNFIWENLSERCSNCHEDENCKCLDDLKKTFLPTIKKYVESNASATYTNLMSDEHCDNLIDFFVKELNFDRFNCGKDFEDGSETKEEIEDAEPPLQKKEPLRAKRISGKPGYLVELDYSFLIIILENDYVVVGILEDQENPDSVRPLTRDERTLAISYKLSFSDETLEPFIEAKSASKQ
jgi:hypothetical protein